MKWNYRCLDKFKEDIFKGIINVDNLWEEISLKTEDDEQKAYWVLFKDRKKYLIEQKVADELPIKINRTSQIHYKGKVFHFIEGYSSVKITPEKFFSFRELVDSLCDYKHSNPDEFLLYKIISIVSYIDRINARVTADAAFGKDSVMNILASLTNQITNTNPNSLASIEFRLLNKVVVLNELSNLATEQRRTVQEALLLIGDFSNTYEKSTRGSSSYRTRDTYDISQLSLLIIYNPLSYYEKSGQEDRFFDKIFQPAVLDRFIPFEFEGSLDIEQFNKTKYDKDIYLKVLKTLEYFRKENEKTEHTSDISLKGRWGITFNRILNYIGLYSESKEEFDKMVTLLYDCHLRYLRKLGKGGKKNETGLKQNRNSWLS